MELMADRSTHMRYLKSQISRVSSCCENVHRLGASLEDLRGGLTVMQDKVVNLAKLLDHEHQFVDATTHELRSNIQDVVSKQGMIQDLLFGQDCQVMQQPVCRHCHLGPVLHTGTCSQTLTLAGGRYWHLRWGMYAGIVICWHPFRGHPKVPG